jgi:16S rRNA (guanine966-N2)-methyltransferase
VRIVGGRLKRRRLAAPIGDAVRPTSDRARQALFDVLEHGPLLPKRSGSRLADLRVLDVFAGTGAFGLEALSRGAAAATFVERDRRALSALRRNVESLGLGDLVSILAVDAMRLGPPPPRPGLPADLVFLDPPYESGSASPCLAALLAHRWLTGNVLCIAELGAREGFAAPLGFSVVDQRRYGAGRFLFMQPG